MIRPCKDNLYTFNFCKSSIKPPPGGLFNFGPSRGGLIERGLIRAGALFTKSSDKDMFGSSSALLFDVLLNQQSILRFKYIISTQFLSQNISKLTCKVVLLSKWKYLVNSRTLQKWGGGAHVVFVVVALLLSFVVVAVVVVSRHLCKLLIVVVSRD